MENAGSAFRLANCFNNLVIIIISNNELEMQKIYKTARNCEKYIPFKIVTSSEKAYKIIIKNVLCHIILK